MLRLKYKRDGSVEDLREFKDYNEFVDWLHRQLFIEPITLIYIEEII